MKSVFGIDVTFVTRWFWLTFFTLAAAAHLAAVKKINKNHRVNFKLHQSLDTFDNWSGPKSRNYHFRINISFETFNKCREILHFMSKAVHDYANYTYFCGVLWCSRRKKCLFQLQLPLSVEGWKQSSAVLSLTQQYTTRAAALYFVPFESLLNKGPYYKNTYPHVCNQRGPKSW